jgi:hypothetical protein
MSTFSVVRFYRTTHCLQAGVSFSSPPIFSGTVSSCEDFNHINNGEILLLTQGELKLTGNGSIVERQYCDQCLLRVKLVKKMYVGWLSVPSNSVSISKEHLHQPQYIGITDLGRNVTSFSYQLEKLLSKHRFVVENY